MRTLKLSLGTRTKHGLHTKLVVVVLSRYYVGAKESKKMALGVPMVWREPKGHGNECYYFSCKTSGFVVKNKHNIHYPNVAFAIRSVIRDPDVPIPNPPQALKNVEDSSTGSDLSSSSVNQKKLQNMNAMKAEGKPF